MSARKLIVPVCHILLTQFSNPHRMMFQISKIEKILYNVKEIGNILLYITVQFPAIFLFSDKFLFMPGSDLNQSPSLKACYSNI